MQFGVTECFETEVLRKRPQPGSGWYPTICILVGYGGAVVPYPTQFHLVGYDDCTHIPA
jgi:hypothetical protein